MTIALIAGTGGLPPHLVQSLVAQDRQPIVCEMRGFKSYVSGDFERLGFRLETLGTFLHTLKKHGVVEVCMAGALQRPDVDPSAIDAATAPLVPRLTAAMAKGDDGTLREIVAIFEEQGFAVTGAADIAPDLLPAAGLYTIAAPNDLTQDLAAAQVALVGMGQADQGQAMVLRDGAVIAIEDAGGTEAMLADFQDPQGEPSPPDGSMGELLGAFGEAIESVFNWLSSTDGDQASGDGAVLFKAPKPNQTLKVDMPLIGPDTAMQAAEAGLAGLVIPAGKVMVLDMPQVVAILDSHDMFLQVIP